MAENAYEAELRQALAEAFVSGAIRDTSTSGPVFLKLSQAFPTLGSKIDWAAVPASVERRIDSRRDEAVQCIQFFDEMRRRFALTGEIAYVGDALTDIALLGSFEAIRAALPSILSIPQHHDLVGPDTAWCLSFTMEGDMAFGLRPGVQAGVS